MVALLTVTPGCSSGDQARSGHVHIDRNNDGYCDEDGEPMPRGSGSTYHGSHYYGTYGGPTHYGGTTSSQSSGSGHAASISSGSSSHGGIGSSHSGGGG